MGTCDKCGKDVPRENSALVLSVMAYQAHSVNYLLNMDRHLFQVHLFPLGEDYDGGGVSCEGSPSRVRICIFGDKADPETGLRYQLAWEVLRNSTKTQKEQFVVWLKLFPKILKVKRWLSFWASLLPR